MTKKEMMEGLMSNSTFKKMSDALQKQPTREQILEEELKWEKDLIAREKEEEANYILSQIKGEVKPQLKPLTDEERNLLPILIKYLQRKTNDMVHLTADEIIRDFNNNKEKLGMKNNFNIPRLMKLTAYIRYNELAPLVSGSSGYFISNDPYVILSCYQSLYSRAEAIIAAAMGMKHMATNMIIVNKNNSSDPFGFDFD